MTSSIVLALLTVLVAVGVVRLSTRCQHVHGETGESLLTWTWHDGAIRGWCPQCLQFTSGWTSAKPQFDRLPSARIATAEEVARFRKQRDARRRLAQRMRTA